VLDKKYSQVFCFKLENLAFQKGAIYLALYDKSFIQEPIEL
jgi:hypothetical protein